MQEITKIACTSVGHSGNAKPCISGPEDTMEESLSLSLKALTQCQAISISSRGYQGRELVVIAEDAMCIEVRATSHDVVLVDDGDHSKLVQPVEL